jgi:DNA polymerase-3 subunit alpha
MGANAPVIPKEDFSREELLALEKETLGLFLTAHPLRDMRTQIRVEAEHMIADVAALPDGAVTTVVGMVGAVKRITTKKSGEVMAFVTLEGIQGSVEMLCFPAIYQENSELIVEDKVIKVKGRVDHKDEAETKLIPISVEPFVARTGTEPVLIRLDGEACSAAVLDDLKAIICLFPGPCPVELDVRTSADCVRVRFGDGFRVDPQTSFFAELRVLLGESCVA